MTALRPRSTARLSAPAQSFEVPRQLAADSAANLLTESEVAQILRTSTRALQAWRVRGGGPPFVRVGRLVRYSNGALNDWLSGQTRRSTSE